MRILFFSFLVTILSLLTPRGAQAAPEKILVRPDAAFAAPVSSGRVDHGAWDELLQRYANEDGMVRYAAWKQTGREPLRTYLRAMAAIDPGGLSDKKERMAYWINVYNALTVHGMLEFYPTKSIKDHVSRLFGFHFWKDVRIEVNGTERSLDAIEHEILRKMGDPRIHFAIVCASIGCPRLWNHAYTGEGLDAQLDANARHFFAQPRHYRLDRAGHTLHLSSIFKWFGEDFGGTDEALREVAARYVGEDDARYIREKTPEIEFLPYDWRINEQ